MGFKTHQANLRTLSPLILPAQNSLTHPNWCFKTVKYVQKNKQITME